MLLDEWVFIDRLLLRTHDLDLSVALRPDLD